MSTESISQLAPNETPKVETFKMGRVVLATLTSMFKQALVIFPGALGFIILTQALGYLGTLGLAPEELIVSPVCWTTMVAALLVGFAFQAFVVHAVVEGQRGNKPTIGGSLKASLRSLFTLVVTGIIVLIGCYAGMILLLVPGIILFVMWSVAVPVIVVERVGPFKALGRSQALTKGSRWQIFGLCVIAIALAALMTFSIYGFDFQLMATAMQMANVQRLIATALVTWISSVMFYTGLAAIYSELRLIKEGVPKNEVAAAFE
jgi:hypothetical protein